jgi:hypothetical protein
VAAMTPIQEQALAYSVASVHGLAYVGMAPDEYVGFEPRLAGLSTVEVMVTVTGARVTVWSKKLDYQRFKGDVWKAWGILTYAVN